MVHGADTPVRADSTFLQTGPQTWDITVETDGGTLVLREGGKRLWIGGEEVQAADDGEYPRLYRRFAELVQARASDVDLRPLQLVADAFLARAARLAVRIREETRQEGIGDELQRPQIDIACAAWTSSAKRR